MEIKILETKDYTRWDKFIKNNTSATFFQQIGWKNVVEKTFGHKPLYLFAEQEQEMVGLLPLFLVNSRVWGKQLVSVPYGPYGGCCALNQNISNSLVERAMDLSKEHKVRYLELRNAVNLPGMLTNDKHVTMLLNLIAGEEIVWSNLRKGMKACVKKAVKEDFNIILNSKNIRGFYSVYCERMHDLGTPVVPFSFFQNISDNFPDMNIATIDYKGKILASQVLLFFKNTVIYGWGASSNFHVDAHPVHSLLWKVIQNCIINGYEVFDFGRSAQGSGTYNFKKWWGAEPQPLYYQYHLNNGRKIPDIHPSNPKYKTAIQIWRRIPLRVANWIGPHISKELL